jgi:hypothetical protein
MKNTNLGSHPMFLMGVRVAHLPSFLCYVLCFIRLSSLCVLWEDEQREPQTKTSGETPGAQKG